MEKKSKIIKDLFTQSNLDELSTEFFYMRHVNQDEKYNAIEVDISNDLVDWIKKDIRINLINYWDTDKKNFNVEAYNHELSLMDTIAELNLNSNNYGSVKETKDKMIAATIEKSKSSEKLKYSNFNLIKFSTNEDSAYFGYYKGTRKNGKKKKIAILEGDKFIENEHIMIDIGGSISFIVHDETVYIIQPRNFEFAFKYSDHITKMRNENIDNLIKLPMFPDEESKEIFRTKASNHLFSRSLANMNKVTFSGIEQYYNDRCKELKSISDTIKDNPEKKANIIKEKGVLVDLLDFIDFENNNLLKISNESDIKPLLHLFQDKIVEKYLTKTIGLMSS